MKNGEQRLTLAVIILLDSKVDNDIKEQAANNGGLQNRKTSSWKWYLWNSSQMLAPAHQLVPCLQNY